MVKHIINLFYFITHALDKTARKGFIYTGYPLKNKFDKNKYYVSSLDDCQELCDVTENCHYYNYINNSKVCFLKYGMGTKKIDKHQTDYFGFKYGTGSGLTIRSVCQK